MDVHGLYNENKITKLNLVIRRKWPLKTGLKAMQYPSTRNGCAKDIEFKIMQHKLNPSRGQRCARDVPIENRRRNNNNPSTRTECAREDRLS